MGDENLVRQLIANYSPSLFALKFIIFVLAYSMGVLALANPRKPNDYDKIARRGIDVGFGIVVFAGRAYMQMPLTTDHAAASMLISGASPEIVPTQGTVVSEALRT